MLEKIIEGEDYFVLAQPGSLKSEVWVTFSAFKDRGPISVAYLEKHGIPALHVVNKADKWFQGLGIVAVRECLRSFVAGAPRVIVFGVSMGGFGALLHAHALGADVILVSGPQVLIDPVFTEGNDERWRPEWASLQVAGHLPSPNAASGHRAGRTFVLYDDKCREDVWHVGHLAGRPNLTHIVVPYGGHGIMDALREAGLLEAITQTIRFGDDDALQTLSSLYRKVAKRSYAYICELGLVASDRGHGKIATHILTKASNLKPDRHVAFTYLSRVLEHMGDLSGSLEAARQAADRAGGALLNSGLFERLAHLHGLGGDMPSAEAAYTAGIIALPGSATLHANFAHFLSVTGRGRERVAVLLHQACKLEPSNVVFAQNVGQLSAYDFLHSSIYLEEQGDLEGAIEHVEEAFARLTGESAEWVIVERLAHLGGVGGDLDGAQRAYLRGLEAMPANAELKERFENFLSVTGR